MEANTTTKKSLGIVPRTALLSWLVTLMTLSVFVTFIIPMQTQTILENLHSKALGIAVSLQDVTAGAVINEDYSSVVDHCSAMLKGDKGLDYIVITKSDGFSIVMEQTGWRIEPGLPQEWRPARLDHKSGIQSVSLFEKTSFLYSHPLNYSAIYWGWIHVGLSIESYNRSVHALYLRTGILALICILLSLVASLAYAKRIVKPVISLQRVVQQVANGNLSARAPVVRGDEIGSLASAVNSMTISLQDRDRILQSIRFAAQQFMQAAQWDHALDPVLSKIGQGAGVSRAYVFENHTDDAGRLCMSQRYEWTAAEVSRELDNPDLQNMPYAESGFGYWIGVLGQNEILTGTVSQMSAAERAVFEPQGIRSIIVIPVFVQGVWWGFVGLDDCVKERVWTDAEKDSLRAGADMLGATIARQRVQDALVIAKEGAEAASRAKSEFLANMSHELRTPLNHIIGFTDLVLSRSVGELSAEQEEYLKDVLSSSRHLLSLINDVLDLSKVEAGKMELELSEVRIRELLENSLVMVKEKAQRQQLRLEVELDGAPELLLADGRKLKQVVYNLLSNAVKFTPAGGEVRLGARVMGASELQHYPEARDLNGDSMWLSLWVADTGIGLERKHLERIFKPFEQVESSLSRKFQGTGLGLALTRKMVELHGGAIWVESEGAGAGSTFRMAIPLREASGEVTAAAYADA
jgi:signal transduction histidine kinase